MRNIKQKLAQIIEDLKPYDPEKIILFGSYAQGKPRPESDIDLLIVKKNNKLWHHRIKDVYDLIYKSEYLGNDEKFPGPVDPFVYTPKELKYRYDLGDFFVREILDEGKIIYEKKS